MKWMLVAACLALSGCAGTAELYPANDIARGLGPLTAELTKAGMGSGPASLRLPNGEVLRGRYSVDVGGSTGFGSLYASVYGAGGYAAGSGFGSAFAIPNSNPGMADLVGTSGTTAHCEFVSSSWTGHGNGVCELSNKALYRMQF